MSPIASSCRITLIACLALFAAIAHAQTATLPTGITRGSTVEGVTEYTLANGLRVLMLPDATKPTQTVNVTYLVGSRHENYGETGMAHLLEHLVFKGTKSIPNVFIELGRRGMRFNGTTFFDRTNYFETFSANDESLDWALMMEAERMTSSTFSKADLDTEMTVVRNEFESGENNPELVLWKRLQALAFDWHNYGNVTIGARSDVENVDINRLRAFYATYYQPDNAVLIVAGKIDPAKTLAMIAKYFGAIAKPARTLPRLYTADPVQDGERTVTVRRVGSQKIVGLLYRTLSGAHPDSVAISALADIMTVAPAGRMYRALVETKKAVGVEGEALTLHDAGTLLFFAQVAIEDPVEPARDAMLATLAAVRTQPITNEEVERVRAKAMKAYDTLFNDPEKLAVALSEAIATGDWRLMYLSRDQWRKLKPEDVQRAALAYTKEANRVVGTFIPDASPDRAPVPPAVDVAALVAGYKGDESVAAGEAFEATTANLDARTERFTLPGGLKVALLPKKTRGGTVRFSMRLHQGDEKSLFGTRPVGGLMGGMLSRGTKVRNRQAFEDELDKLRAKLGLSASERATTAGGETVRENLPALMRLAAEALRTPSFPEDEFERLKRQTAAALEATRTEPNAIVQRALARHDNPYPKGDVRYASTLDEGLAELAKATIGDVRNFHQRFVGASYGEIAVVGDFDAKEIRALIEDLFGNWKSPSPYTRVRDPYQQTTPVEMRFETPDKPNAIIFGTTEIKLRDLDPDYPALAIAERVLGGSTDARLSIRLREKSGTSYDVGSFLQPGQIEDKGAIGFYAIFPANALTNVRAALGEEVSRALKEGFTAEEVATAKRALLEQRRTARAQDSVVVGALVQQSFLSRTFAESARIDAAIENVDVAAANAALRKYIDEKHIAWAFAGDFARK
ncbi:MAG TPA: pitrilysin family protein [Casimicrobiaceae bacterium]|nr:pitrilysin family protein [Casimicrobiaceae bacterium]